MRYFYLLVLFWLSNPIAGQVSTRNYIRTRTMLNETGSSYMDLIVYYDGLGRPFQTVFKGITPSNQNLVSLQEFDEMGRESKSWLPVVSTSDYVASIDFISNAPGNYNNDSRPYHQSVYEFSPLNRKVQQYGPGVAWYSGHSVTTEYLVNTTASPLNCINYSVNSSGSLVNNGNYASSRLYVTKTIDEDDNIGYVFIDELGRVILTRKMKDNVPHDTYYVYDDYGNLSFVLQPMYQDNKNLFLYAFQYKYDERNRCVEKKQPGTEAIKYVYDMTDKLVFSQDGNQRALGQWTFYLYDKFLRLTVTGVCNNANTASASSSTVTCTQVTSNGGLDNSGYSSSFVLTTPIAHQVNYYDNYDFRSLTGFTNVSYFPAALVDAKGHQTGSITNVLGSGTKLYSANYYDIKGRVVKSVSSNHMGGYETFNTAYTFTGKPLTVQHIHTASGKNTQTELYTYMYDHAERVIKIQYVLNGNTITLTSNTYDDLGRLLTKSSHGAPANKLTYAYNIRDWLTEIKSTKFTQNLYYNVGNGVACYNGNISSMTWKSGDDGIYGYKFTYDNLDRMRNATYGEGVNITPPAGKNFSENVTDYDLNGNIRGLQRYGKVSSNAYGKIDDLSITYVGNQFNNVSDVATDPLYSGAFNFVDGNKSSIQEYKFDANGNLVQDYNKKIAKIQYNSLNLPSALQFTNGNRADYLYSSDGMKRRVTHKTAIANISVPMGQIKDLTSSQISQTSTTDYCGNVIYENGSLSKILIEGGYVTLSGTTPTYHYYLKDHQGNNRVVINQAGTVEQVNHYYPFGGLFGEGTATSNQAYKYNGKELDRMHGMNWYDYGARMYDSSLGRFMTMDPLAEKYYSISLYGFCQNNPVNIIDPDGKSTWVINNSDGTYRIVGGDLKDEDRNIYIYKILDGQLVRDGSIGKTDLMTSFYNSDAREGEGEWAIGSIIDPNDDSGKIFLESFNKEEPSIIEYMTFGVGGKKYDFKREGTKKGDISYNNPTYFYRGMPIKSKNGEMIFSSARDIGNYAAGYIAGHLQIKWEWARRQFDKLESNQKGYNTSEGYSSQNAQYRGWNDGLKSSIDNPLKTLRWTLKTITFIFD